MTNEEKLIELRREADRLEIPYSTQIGLAKLQEKIDAAKAKTTSAPKAKEETETARYARLRKEANQNIRVQLTCMNPAKAAWKGDFYETGNKVVGTIKKYIPFNAGEDGYHIPKMLLDVLKGKQYQSFYTVKGANGKDIKRGKQVPEFGIVELPPLTEKELRALAARQGKKRLA